jgi:murein DD-endopeptidase MepM/ murein hydrolase activator NlpD
LASAALVGVLFVAFIAIPSEVRAGFFSSILNNETYGAINASFFNKSSNNSQTMELLQSNVPPSQIFKDKDSKKSNNKEGQESKIDQTGSINIVSETSLLPTTSPQSVLGVGTGGADFSFEEEDIEIYVVKTGDTAQIVADMFDVSVDTIYSANDMKKGDKLSVDNVLLILPFSGVEHTVAKGETPQSIASKYKVEVRDIRSANDLDANAKLTIGDKLMIPDAHILDTPTAPTKINQTKNIANAKGKNTQTTLPSVSGYFKTPVAGASRSRGIQGGHRGVDLAAPAGTPIHAAAGGTVIIARNGYNGGFGNYVVVQHNNGTKTLYAHMSKLGTNPGATVSQGETIGYVGNTGSSRGNHLHIEVLGGRNPF